MPPFRKYDQKKYYWVNQNWAIRSVENLNCQNLTKIISRNAVSFITNSLLYIYFFGFLWHLTFFRCHLFVLYWSPASSLCTFLILFHQTLTTIYWQTLLLIYFPDLTFNVHHRDWWSYSSCFPRPKPSVKYSKQLRFCRWVKMLQLYGKRLIGVGDM